jgi:hypothetical protein
LTTNVSKEVDANLDTSNGERTNLGKGDRCVGENIKYKTKMAICHHKYVGIHLTNLSTEGKISST